MVVRSPGVSIYRPELRGLKTTTPTALWMAEREGRDVIGVTATKGKSTTSKLIAHLIAKAGVPVRLGGNIGAPALDLLGDDALAVIELSSYQIADLAAGPETAVVSNVYAEHVNWHGSVEAYRSDKLRLLALPGVSALRPERDRAAGHGRAAGRSGGVHVRGGAGLARDRGRLGRARGPSCSRTCR